MISFGSVFYALGSLFFLIVEKYEMDSDLSAVSVY